MTSETLCKTVPPECLLIAGITFSAKVLDSILFANSCSSYLVYFNCRLTHFMSISWTQDELVVKSFILAADMNATSARKVATLYIITRRRRGIQVVTSLGNERPCF